MSKPIVTLEIESYPQQRKHFLVVRHPDGHGLYHRDDSLSRLSGVTTTLGQFLSRQQAEAALEVVKWYGENRFCDGMRAERERLEEELTR